MMNTLISKILLLIFSTLATADKPEQQGVACGLNNQASVLAQLIISDSGQQRPVLQCNQLLAEIAQQRAEQLGNHTNDPDITPNQVLIKGGFRMPNYYPVSGNQVEAVAANLSPAKQVMAYLKDSQKHQDHVLGEGEFFALQSQLGIGYHQSSDDPSINQWVVLIAAPWQSPKIVFKQDFVAPYQIKKGCEKGWEKSKDPFLFNKCSKESGKKIMFVQ